MTNSTNGLSEAVVETPDRVARSRACCGLTQRSRSLLPLSEAYDSDRYEVYRWLPRDVHHVGKGGPANWNERAHSILRNRLCRLRHRTKGYTKRVWWLRASLAMVCLYLGWI
ncbi:MAG: hypothetical protein O3A46_13225 [Candidatus Poribacteria bacterium]|nr:hypothetical protein [Candidatus Poribacteria bacterium]